MQILDGTSVVMDDNGRYVPSNYRNDMQVLEKAVACMK